MKRFPTLRFHPHVHTAAASSAQASFGLVKALNPDVMRQSFEALDCDVFFTIGTSSLVYPAAALVHEAKARGAYTVEINVEATPASSQLNLTLQGSAEEILDAIDAKL
jgi:NAD-dependent deacetylase